MIKAERLRLITDHIQKKQSVHLNELSHLLNVSEDTVRRDIKELSDQGLLRAVRGGAVAHSPIPQHYREREHYNVQNKEIIAQKAVQFVKDGQVVVFDGGTSALAVAASIPKDIRFTAVTNSFPVASVLEDHPGADVIFAGGRLNKQSFSTLGYETVETFRSIRADICFLGICSIDISTGVTVRDYEDGQVKKVITETSQQVIALFTQEKIGTAEPYYICAANSIHTMVTDADPFQENLQAFRDAGIRIV